MKPFDEYPNAARELLGRLSLQGSCRHEYGLTLQQFAGQTTCAYCGQSLVDTYAHWLLLSVDHVVPQSAGRKAGIENHYLEDRANCVLCCSGCNGFQWKGDLTAPQSAEEFITLRDDVFRRKAEWLIERRTSEQEFFGTRPWEQRSISSDE